MKCLSNMFSYFLLDAISAANPRVIDDSRARKLSNDLKRCTYYETCSTYGLNVERVFQDGERGAKKSGNGLDRKYDTNVERGDGLEYIIRVYYSSQKLKS